MNNSWNDNIWANDVGYGARAPKVPYLTDEQNCRLERMRVARMLWKGNHRKVYLTERRSQFDFPELEVQGFVWWPFLTFNMLRLITTTMSDLLLLEDPTLTIADPEFQEALDGLKSRSDTDRVMYDAVKAASWSGEGMIEVIRWQGDVYLQDVKSSEIFPVGERQPDGQFPAYQRFATAQTIERTPRKLLLITTYSPGQIARQCFLVGDDGTKGNDVDLSLWPVKGEGGADLKPVEATGIEWNTIVWVGNEMDEGMPTSDYDGLIELQDSLDAKQTQIARVIAQNADPAIAFPEYAADDDGNIRTRKKAFFFRSKDEIPQYITWNAELSAAMEDRDFAMTALSIAAEMPLGLLGLDKGAVPDSARKLRLQAGKGLARAKRKAKFVKPFIRTAAETALMMIRAGKRVQIPIPGMNGDGAGIAVDLHDGLPVDDLDQATTISTLRTAGVISLARAIALQIPDPEGQAKEIEAIEEENASKMPSVLMGDAPAPGAAGGDAADGSDAEQAKTYDEGQNT